MGSVYWRTFGAAGQFCNRICLKNLEPQSNPSTPAACFPALVADRTRKAVNVSRVRLGAERSSRFLCCLHIRPPTRYMQPLHSFSARLPLAGVSLWVVKVFLSIYYAHATKLLFICVEQYTFTDAVWLFMTELHVLSVPMGARLNI